MFAACSDEDGINHAVHLGAAQSCQVLVCETSLQPLDFARLDSLGQPIV